MIKIVTFHSHLITDVDDEAQAFIKDHEIKREDIILLKPYVATNNEDGWMYHYIKLVYETERKEKTWGCRKCGHIIGTNIEKPDWVKCGRCGEQNWGEVKLEQ